MAGKILIVEDDADQRDFLEVLLRLEGFTTATAADGGEAITYATRELPDLIISDIRMPEVDGIELVRRLRQIPQACHVPILVLSGDSSGDLRHAVRAGADLALRKPQKMDQLLQTVKQMLY